MKKGHLNFQLFEISKFNTELSLPQFFFPTNSLLVKLVTLS